MERSDSPETYRRTHSPEAYRRIIDDAIVALPPARRFDTNLYLDTVPYEAGDVIGPEFQGIRASRRSVLIFADENPLANFGHDCRYLLYDAETQKFLKQERARFPPFRHRAPGTFRPVYQPVRFACACHTLPPPPIYKVLADPNVPLDQSPQPVYKTLNNSSAQRERYAILFAGRSDRRHLNQLEYCWRMLTGPYHFEPENVFVLFFDGTRTLPDWESATNWPQENFTLLPQYDDPYQLKIFGTGDQSGFRKACGEIAKSLSKDDLVFIQTSGHGDAKSGRSYLLQHDEQRYFVDEFCKDLQLLGDHESLLILMEQCYSVGFIAPLLNAQAAIQAKRLSIACASQGYSFPASGGLFNAFGMGWIAGQLGIDPEGNATNYDWNSSTFIEAKEAYECALDYKNANDTSARGDSPSGSGGAEDIRLT